MADVAAIASTCPDGPAAGAGTVELLGGGFLRAHVQRRGDDGRKDNIYGPRRGDSL